MFHIFRDSLFDPKKIITYQNKRTSTFIFYLLLLALFMTTGTFVYYLGFSSNSEISIATTGCTITDNHLSCTGENHDPNEAFILYDFTFYFLDESESIEDVNMLESEIMVFQGTNISLYRNGNEYLTWSSVELLAASPDFDTMMSAFTSGILIVSIFVAYILNLLLLLFWILISTVAFSQYRRFMKFGEIYKLVGFATTPVAAVIAFNSLINMSNTVFFILFLGSYYSLYYLRRGLSLQIYEKMKASMPVNKENDEDEFEEDSTNEEDK
ncbi:MAG: DUF1189 family protein [Candidatus Izemoplasmatales bacterium]